MATNIPPHNLGELCDALIALVDGPEARDARTCSSTSRARTSRPAAQIAQQQAGAPRDLRDGPGRGPRPRRVEARGAASAAAQQIVITSIPYTVNKRTLVDEDRRPDPRAEAAAAGRRARRVDRRRAHRARDQEGRRSRAGDGVPVQAHAAADELPRQPDLPGARPTNPEVGAPAAARPQGDAPLLPRLPLRGGHAGGSSSSSRELQKRHPHPRGLREGLRRARRDDPHHPQVRRQGGRGARS